MHIEAQSLPYYVRSIMELSLWLRRYVALTWFMGYQGFLMHLWNQVRERVDKAACQTGKGRVYIHTQREASCVHGVALNSTKTQGNLENLCIKANHVYKQYPNRTHNSSPFN